ncbi:MAG: ComEC/Rec2 family competence protein [Nocardioidaceae bacterium]|nr:ComEC/Rec2 family competence protein [Nocardioidaceae bacterium]
MPEPRSATARQNSSEPSRDRPDLRSVALGASGWAGGLVVLGGATVLVLLIMLAAAVLVMRGRLRGRTSWLLISCALAFTAVAGTAAIGVEAHRASPVARLAEAQASVTMVAQVVSDPVRREGRFTPFVLVRLSSQEVEGLGRSFHSEVPVLLIGGPEWARTQLGDSIEVTGRLRPADDVSVAAVLLPRRGPIVLRTAGPVLGAAESVRHGIREATDHGSQDARALVPALVVGDDRRMAEEVVADFRTTGLTHLAAVSGTNLTLVVGFLLILARWMGVRARGLVFVGVLGVIGFVLLARTEPSVVRAAVMGSVALVGMGTHGRRQGARALGVAVLVLLLVDPWLAVSWGFVLSVLATAGILFLAPTLRDALMQWLPRWAAEAVAVPFSAQLACTPAVAALSGQVSLVAVFANMLVAVAVGPATVLGLVGGLLHLVVPALGAAVGLGAVACGWWIIAVATALARLPAAAVEWSSGPIALSLLTLVCLVVAWVSGRVLGARLPALAVAVIMVAVVVVPLPTPGWPPRGWLMVACDVGQGDGLVLHAGAGQAVVVDAGPDPALIDGCLDRLEVRRVPVVVLTHFHADHVDGLPGVLDGRQVGEVLVSALADPAEGAVQVSHWLESAGVPMRVAGLGETTKVGTLTWQVIGPARISPHAEGSAANDASTVLLIETEGIRILASGDMEPPAQAMLRRAVPDLAVDVLKVPHHGSADQDPELLTSLGARVAVVSVGEDNTYGHPATSTLDLLEDAGMLAARTDLRGDVAVTLRDGRLAVVSSGPRG